MLEILAVVKHGLEGRKAHQRHTRHLIMDTWLLEKISEKEGKKTEKLSLLSYLLLNIKIFCNKLYK